MTQNLSGDLIRPTLQSELKIFGDKKKSRIPYFQLPKIKFQRFRALETLHFGSKETIIVRKDNVNLPPCNDSLKIIPRRLCNVTSAIRLRILRSAGSGCIGFSTIQIFSEPLKNSGKDDQKPESKFSFFGDYGKSPESHGIDSKTALKSNLKSFDSRKIPDWCFDAVTHEIMEHPVQLPSSHWVDNSTVVKWRNESKIWYAGLTDPFTGKKIDYDLIVDTDKRNKILEVTRKLS